MGPGIAGADLSAVQLTHGMTSAHVYPSLEKSPAFLSDSHALSSNVVPVIPEGRRVEMKDLSSAISPLRERGGGIHESARSELKRIVGDYKKKWTEVNSEVKGVLSKYEIPLTANKADSDNTAMWKKYMDGIQNGSSIKNEPKEKQISENTVAEDLKKYPAPESQ